MSAPTQGQVRTWARAEGMTVNQRGSLPATVVRAYLAAHASPSKKGATPSPSRKAAKPSPGRKAAKPARGTTGRKARVAAKPQRRARPAATSRPARAAAPATADVAAAPAGATDLAAGLRTYLAAVEAEVRAVSALSERIDALVAELNEARDQQAKRLLVLDALRASVTDQSLGAFLKQAIKPRRTRVPEVVPDRLA